MKELRFTRKSESFLQIPIKLIIKQHIFKAFALTGRREQHPDTQGVALG